MTDTYAYMLMELMTAVDSHRLSNPERDSNDQTLYDVVKDIRRRLA